MHGKDENIKFYGLYCQLYVDSWPFLCYLSPYFGFWKPIAILKQDHYFPFIIYCFGLEHTQQDGILLKFCKVQVNKPPYFRL